MKKYIQLIKNTGLFAIASISTKLISFIFLPLYTIYLTTEEYAIVDLATVMQSLIWPILSLSLTEGLLRFALDKSFEKEDIFTNTTLLIIPGLFISSVLFLFINLNDSLYMYRGYFLIYYTIVSLNDYLSIFCRTIGSLKLIVFNSILSSLLIAIFNVIFLVFFKMGINGYFFSLIIGNAVSFINYIFLGKMFDYIRINRCNKVIIRSILIYSIPMIPNTIFWWINSSLDKICLTSMIGLSAVGLYSVAGKVSSALTMCTNIFNQAWSMSAFSQYKEKDSDKFFSNIFNVYNIILCVIASTLIVFTKPVAKILFSNDFYGAWIYVPILILAFYFNGLNVYYGTIFTTYKKTNLIFITTGVGAIFNIVLNIIFIQKIGAIGAAIATVFSNYVVYIIRFTWSKKYINLKTIKLYNNLIIIILSLLSFSVIKQMTVITILSYLFILTATLFVGYKYFVILKKQKKGKIL